MTEALNVEDEMPKAYEPGKVEQKWYQFWLKKSYFKARVDPDKKPFVIIMPLPNVTGGLHIGHALFVTLEDIIEVNGREGYEIIYKSPPMKTREVVFLTNGRAFTISYSTTEDLYAASEEIFDHVINSFVIK